MEILLIALLAGGGYFGYKKYKEHKAEDVASQQSAQEAAVTAAAELQKQKAETERLALEVKAFKDKEAAALLQSKKNFVWNNIEKFQKGSQAYYKNIATLYKALVTNKVFDDLYLFLQNKKTNTAKLLTFSKALRKLVAPGLLTDKSGFYYNYMLSTIVAKRADFINNWKSYPYKIDAIVLDKVLRRFSYANAVILYEIALKRQTWAGKEDLRNDINNFALSINQPK